MDVIEVLKAKTEGMPDEVVITLTTQQGRALIEQLEAERQRAERNDSMLSECLESLKATEKELGIRSHQLVKADASVADLEKRLICTEEALIAATDLHSAALKGDQVPYGYYSAETATILEQQGHANITKTPSGNWQFPLFTRAQSIPDMVHWSADGEWSQAQCLGWNMCCDAMLFTAPQNKGGEDADD